MRLQLTNVQEGFLRLVVVMIDKQTTTQLKFVFRSDENHSWRWLHNKDGGC